MTKFICGPVLLCFMKRNQSTNMHERKSVGDIANALFIAIPAITAATTVCAYYNGLDVAPFSWVLPESTLNNYRDYLQTAPRDAQSYAANVGFYLGAIAPIVLSSPLVLWLNVKYDAMNRESR